MPNLASTKLTGASRRVLWSAGMTVGVALAYIAGRVVAATAGSLDAAGAFWLALATFGLLAALWARSRGITRFIAMLFPGLIVSAAVALVIFPQTTRLALGFQAMTLVLCVWAPFTTLWALASWAGYRRDRFYQRRAEKAARATPPAPPDPAGEGPRLRSVG